MKFFNLLLNIAIAISLVVVGIFIGLILLDRNTLVMDYEECEPEIVYRESECPRCPRIPETAVSECPPCECNWDAEYKLQLCEHNLELRKKVDEINKALNEKTENLK